MADLRIATRRSRLAITQARLVQHALEAAHPGIDTTLVEVASAGDTDRTTPIAALTEVGAFVRAIQQAVLDGRADLAVHSCKDLPTDGPGGLVAHYPRRAEPWDALVGAALDDLPDGAVVGTGSPRRQAQLRRLRPDLRSQDIRGNVVTRIRKVMEGEYHAVVLAQAGLSRLGLEDEIAQRFGIEEMVPAPGQAALAVETSDTGDASSLVAAIDHAPTRSAVEAERRLLARTGAGCRAALGALAAAEAPEVTMWGFVEDEEGPRRSRVTAPDARRAADLLQRELGL